MRPTAVHLIRRISSICTDPVVAERKLRSTVTLGLQKVTTTLRRNLLERLLKKNLGTHQVENIVKSLSSSNKRTRKPRDIGLITSIMKTKISDAKTDMKTIEYQYHKSRRELWMSIPYHSREAQEADLLIKDEMDYKYNIGKSKLIRKIQHLSAKYGPKVPDTVNGIHISDKAIGANKPLPAPLAVDVNISASVKELLQLPPKTATYKAINIVECETEIEKMLVKLKWEKRNEKERKEVGMNKDEWEDLKRKGKEVHNIEKATLNFNGMRVTQLPTNPEIKMPTELPPSEELKCQRLKEEMLATVRKYQRDHCDINGNMKAKNLSKACQSGLKEIKEMCKGGQVVCFPTDKSDRMSILSMESYVQSAQPHITSDKAISASDIRKIERTLEGHTFQMAKLLGLCKDQKDTRRLTGALLNTDANPPSLYLVMKDHKPIRGDESIPARPICGAVTSHNGQLSHILSIIVNAMADHYGTDTESTSTEDMIASINVFNNHNTKKNMNIISMDVKALYPSLDIKIVAATVGQMYQTSELEVKGVVWKEACKYLALVLRPEEIEEIGLQDVVPQRKHNRGRPPGITTSEVRYGLHKTVPEEKSVFKEPIRAPHKHEERRILGKCLEQMILACVDNHTYLFNQETRLQTKGGAIGLKITQALARIYMLWWDGQFLKLAERAGAKIAMYKRYVDDTNIIVEGLEPEKRWSAEHKKLVMEQDKIEEDEVECNDVRTGRELRKMANTVASFIQWEEAVPSRSSGGKLPILDLKCWAEDTLQGRTEVYYEFYRKPMANQLLMLYDSAMPEKVKRTTLSQEVIRILRNCHPDLPWQTKCQHLNAFTERMRDSGYPESFRYEVIQSGLNGYRKMVEVEEAGGRPVNRLQKSDQIDRKRQKDIKKDTWYKNGLYSTVLFVPCTPGSKLAKELKEVEARSADDREWRVKIVEMGGSTLRAQTCKSNPWKGRSCGRQNCFPCQTEKGGDCKRRNVGYTITCQVCAAEYHGETSRTMFCRGDEHLKALSLKSKESVLWSHCLAKHDGNDVQFRMKASSYFSDPLTRQVEEAVRIFHTSNPINRKGEWRKTAIPRATYARE